MRAFDDAAARGGSMGEARAVHADREGQDGKTSGCFDSMSCNRSSKPKMVFTGVGQGEYEKVTHHELVGESKGAWRKEEVVIPYGWRLRKCSICCIAVFTLLCIAGICLCVASLTSTSDEVVRSSAKVAWDCDIDFDDWEKAWGDEQKDYCCLEAGHGCPTTQRPNQFNCEEKRSTWEAAWSDAKKDWCCGFSREKCEPTKSKDAFDCGAGLVNWKEGWSAKKKTWCCDHYGRGCLSPAYDCDVGLDKWRTGWSEEKKAWCCEHSNKGCSDDDDDDDSKESGSEHSGEDTKEESKGDAFDCAAGLDKWEKGWSDDKKAWCCEHKKVKCQDKTKFEGCKTVCVYKGWSATCTDRVEWSMKHQAPESAKDKCEWSHKKVVEECDACSGCDLASAGCETTPASDPYDCSAGEAHWKDGWSPGKKAWCCLMHRKGCSEDSDKLYECGNAIASHWAPQKKEWCCEHKPGLKGCEEVKDQLFNCDDSKKDQWSPPEKFWCCANIGKGCKGVRAGTYNCSAGFATWWSSWSPQKAKYCCEGKVARARRLRPVGTQGKVCKTPDCNADFGSWESKWSQAKKEWCCHQMGRGCVASASVDSDALDAAKG